MSAKPVPEGYHTLTPYISVDDTAGAIDFYKQAFGAKERGRMSSPDGKIAHAEIQIGDSVIILSDPFPQSTVRSPKDSATGRTRAPACGRWRPRISPTESARWSSGWRG